MSASTESDDTFDGVVQELVARLARLASSAEPACLAELAECQRLGERLAACVRGRSEASRAVETMACAMWHSLVEFAPDTILTVALDGRIQFINRLIPVGEPSQIQGTSAFDYVPEEDRARVKALYARVAATGRPESYETRAILPDGSRRWYQTHVGPLRQEERIVGLTLVARDVTPQREAEQQALTARNSMRRMLAAHEREEWLTANELHEGLLQQLAGALMHLEGQRARPPLDGAPLAGFDRALSLLRESLAEGRRLMRGMRPPEMDEFGVVAAIDHLVRDVQRDGIEAEFCPTVAFERLPSIVEGTLFRIAQEALRNVSKHSRATRAEVRLAHDEVWVSLTVRDNGIGFDIEAVPAARFGLYGIRERASLLGGEARIESRPGGGTVVTARLPLVENRPILFSLEK